MTRFPRTLSNDAIKARMRLLLKLLPHFQEQACLALKGGTAINAFLLNLPRLSIDIDMTYVNFVGREQALDDISASLSA
ncbi:MAG: nucleotidyl transferase AbiEii/AbiGii toxin family protein, partial [Betaproteobacteria bacterium]|nr:nucleotidyl transferase AbiEii/AbiGii toxin family protein [Betaproteobacteria bacterium]